MPSYVPDPLAIVNLIKRNLQDCNLPATQS